MYKERKEEVEEDAEPDMVFDGGLRIPGAIWHKLYRSVLSFHSPFLISHSLIPHPHFLISRSPFQVPADWGEMAVGAPRSAGRRDSGG